MKSENYKSWEHIVIPMEFEAKRLYPRSSIGFKDPRTTEGELLWPKVFTKRKVAELKIELGQYRAAGQLQQRPAPPGGGIYKSGDIRLWPKDKPLPIFTYIVQSYDTAFTDDNVNNDPTAMTCWGIFGYSEKDEQGRSEPRTGAMLLEHWEEWLEYPQLRARIIKDFRQLYGGDDLDPANRPRRPDRVLIEKKASGQSIIQELRMQARVPVVPFTPTTSKVARAHEASPHFEAGNIWMLESSVEPGTIHKDARPLVEHLEAFPNGAHMDLADTVAQAILYLAKTGHLTLHRVYDDPITERDYHAEKRAPNPYG